MGRAERRDGGSGSETHGRQALGRGHRASKQITLLPP